jgi:hypothetical protein
MTTNLSPKQLELIAQKVAEKLAEAQDEMWSLERLHKEKGFSKSYIYHNADTLGGVKAGGKWFFSKRNIETLIRSGRL